MQKLKPSIAQALWTKILGTLGQNTTPILKNQIISTYASLFDINLAESAIENLHEYNNLNHLFTRTLKPNARPLANAAFTCPVDGKVSAHGNILENTLLQIKGIPYQVSELVGPEIAPTYTNGYYINWYLAPHNYHRFHMPVAAQPIRMHYFPGKLYSVSPKMLSRIPGLFCVNERVVIEFASQYGNFTLIFIGAIGVSAIEIAWHGIVNSRKGQAEETFDLTNVAPLAQGQDLGCFHLGSAVTLLANNPKLIPSSKLTPSSTWQWGQELFQAKN